MNNQHNDQKNIIIGENTYDLTHLKDFIYKFETDKNIFNIFVHFSCHCFSDVKLRDNIQLKFSCCNKNNNNESRGFCINRYQQSLTLKEDIITMLNNGKVYFSDKQNFMIIPRTQYVVFFNLRNTIKNKNQLNLFVQSAYIKKNVTKDKKKNISFTTLAQKIYEGTFSYS